MIYSMTVDDEKHGIDKLTNYLRLGRNYSKKISNHIDFDLTAVSHLRSNWQK